MQNYTEIPSSQTLQSSLSLLLDNYKSVFSCFSGTSFPTLNVQVGMLCYRTDQKKLYQLREIIETVPTWIAIADLSSDASSQLADKFDKAGGTITGRVTFSNATASTSKTTGALVISGGVGVSGTIYADAFNGALTGNASTATKLATPRSITISGAATAAPTNFDGSSGITLTITSLDATKLSGRIPNGNLTGTYNIDADTVGGFGTARAAAGYVVTTSSGDGVTEIARYLDWHASAVSTEDYTVRLDGGGAGSNTLTLTGNFYATGNVTAFSDRRLKSNILRVCDPVARVRRINGVTFTRNDARRKHRKERFMGVIAQDVRRVAPEAVKMSANGTLAVDYMGLTGLTMEAIKELDARLVRVERLLTGRSDIRPAF